MSDKKARLPTSEEWEMHANLLAPQQKLKTTTTNHLAWVALGVCFVIFIFNPLVGAIFRCGRVSLAFWQ